MVGHTLPLKNRALRPVPTAPYFGGLLALCVILMTYSEVFLVFTIAGFFHAYLLRPWPVGMLGVLATSVALNGSTTRVWVNPTPEVLAEFALIVAVQTAAIGAGILLTARSEPEERKREKLIERLEEALRENAGLHAQLVAQARETGAQLERQRLAGEIHDTLAQGLAGIITSWSGRPVTAPRGVNVRKRWRPMSCSWTFGCPGWTAWPATAALHERDPSVRVLILTTFDSEHDVLPAIEAGAIGYLLKDALPEELMRAVRAAARGESVLAPSVTQHLMDRVRRPGAGTLTDREKEVLQLVANGVSNREAATALFIGEASIKTHLQHIYDKLGVRDRASAVAEGYRRRLLT